MIITKIASGSTGNAIVVDDGDSKILLDAGVPYNKLVRHIRPSSLSGALVTHEHLDHCRAVPTLMTKGPHIYCSKGTLIQMDKKLKMTPYRWQFELMKHGDNRTVGSWTVWAFNVRHDADEPLGFIFKSSHSGEMGVYIVDSGIIEFNFSGVTHWLIEVNHYEAGLKRANIDERAKVRIANNHMSFEKAMTFLKTSDLSKTKEIHLLHLSQQNSNVNRFISDFQSEFGIPVYV